MPTFTPWTTATPTTGWHHASADRAAGLIRHFNGSAWSAPVHEGASESELDSLHAMLDEAPPDVMWWRDLSPEFLAWLDSEAARPLLACAS